VVAVVAAVVVVAAMVVAGARVAGRSACCPAGFLFLSL
jgi:hypothetical protein